MVLQALLVLALGDLLRREVEVARADGVEVTYHIDRSMRHTRTGIRAKAQRAILLRTALYTDTGEGFVMDDDLGISLVVLEENVVAGLMLLDEGIL